MRSTTRITGFAKRTLQRLIPEIGKACRAYHHFMHYNFCRIHQTLRVTPAMEAGLSDHVWTVEELIERIGL